MAANGLDPRLWELRARTTQFNSWKKLFYFMKNIPIGSWDLPSFLRWSRTWTFSRLFISLEIALESGGVVCFLIEARLNAMSLSWASDESLLLSCWWHVWFKFVLGAIHLLTDITFGWVLSNMWKCFSYVFLTDMNFFRLNPFTTACLVQHQLRNTFTFDCVHPLSFHTS